MSKPLDGKTILVTRPAKQAASLVSALQQQGANAPSVPLLEIAPLELDDALSAQLSKSTRAHILICVSVNAAEIGLQHCETLSLKLPDTVIAVGQATAEVFKRHAVTNVYTSDTGSDSEALLAMEQLRDVTGNNIQIWRGGEGRKLLSDTLLQGGAQLELVDLYQRQIPRLSASELNQLLSTDVDIISITSVSSLQNLDALLKDNSDSIADKRLLLGSQRIYQKAVAMGVASSQCLIAENPGNSAMLNALTTQLQHEGQSMTDEEVKSKDEAETEAIEALEAELSDEATEDPEAVEELEPVPLAKPVKKSGGGFGTFLSVLAFLLAAGGIGGAYYFYEKEIKPVLSASVSQQEVSQLNSRITQQSSQLETMGSKVEQASEGVTELRSAVTTERTTLTLAQVEHLVNIASDRLSYMSDPTTAESALQEATERLMDLDEPGFANLQQAIQSDLKNVREYQVVDANEVMSGLNKLVESFRPIPAVEPQQQDALEVEEDDVDTTRERPSSIGDVWNNFKKSMGEKVKVVETDYPVTGISSTAINRYKLDILKLRLEAMRLSLVRSDNIGFVTEIAEAQTWVIENMEDRLAQPILTELLRLRRIDFEIMPDVRQSIKALENASSTLSSIDGPVIEQFDPFSSPESDPSENDTTSSLRPAPLADDCNACELPDASAVDGAVL